MLLLSARARPPQRGLPAAILCLLLAACGGDAESLDATPEDVDGGTPVAVTEEEESRFSAPADSALTEAQVTGYLKTSLLQFDLIRKESRTLHERLAKMEERGREGGGLGQIRNLVDAGRTMAQVGDIVGGSYIRSARTLGYNPAEMEWVRERMSELSGYLAMKPMYDQAARTAAEMRAQAEELRRASAAEGTEAAYAEEQLRQMLSLADEMEENAREQAPARSVQRNLELLRRAKPAVTEETWAAVGFAGGASGLVALSGLADPNDVDAQRKLDEIRRVFEDALENRASRALQETQP